MLASFYSAVVSTANITEFWKLFLRHSSTLSVAAKDVATLTEQQKETFEKFKDCQSEICDLTARQAFTDGFILATRIMVEVMDGMETVEEI